ncbi:MAG: R2-like ligand-binding oxidase [Actinobacteria bacterium]|nr:R2-like ligand-binding oxidase [Actinomycetota bacterium]
MAVRDGFLTTGAGLRDCFPLRLYDKAKRLGVWDPSALDLSRDPEDWARMTEPERQGILQISTLFLAGEEAVTLDLLPLVLAIAREGRIEEELFLTSFLWEEGKHLQLFRRWLDEVGGRPEGLDHWVTPSYRQLFAEELPAAMGALLADPSPATQARAAVTYNMIVEGVLAETGYSVYHNALEERDLLPGLRAGIAHVKRDESRHIAYGVYLLSRLVAADPGLWEVVEARMHELLPLALAFVEESFEGFEELDELPFGIGQEVVAEWATANFSKRFARIERARGRSLAEIEAEALASEE